MLSPPGWHPRTLGDAQPARLAPRHPCMKHLFGFFKVFSMTPPDAACHCRVLPSRHWTAPAAARLSGRSRGLRCCCAAARRAAARCACRSRAGAPLTSPARAQTCAAARRYSSEVCPTAPPTRGRPTCLVHACVAPRALSRIVYALARTCSSGNAMLLRQRHAPPATPCPSGITMPIRQHHAPPASPCPSGTAVPLRQCPAPPATPCPFGNVLPIWQRPAPPAASSPSGNAMPT